MGNLKFRITEKPEVGEFGKSIQRILRVAKPKLRAYYPPLIVGSLSAGVIQSETNNFFLFAWQWWVLVVPIFLVWLWLSIDEEKEDKKDESNTKKPE